MGHFGVDFLLFVAKEYPNSCLLTAIWERHRLQIWQWSYTDWQKLMISLALYTWLNTLLNSRDDKVTFLSTKTWHQSYYYWSWHFFPCPSSFSTVSGENLSQKEGNHGQNVLQYQGWSSLLMRTELRQSDATHWLCKDNWASTRCITRGWMTIWIEIPEGKWFKSNA